MMAPAPKLERTKIPRSPRSNGRMIGRRSTAGVVENWSLLILLVFANWANSRRISKIKCSCKANLLCKAIYSTTVYRCTLCFSLYCYPYRDLYKTVFHL